jgi:hypothetical protein
MKLLNNVFFPDIALIIVIIFSLPLSIIVLKNYGMFFKLHGRKHRLTGAFYLTHLFLGFMLYIIFKIYNKEHHEFENFKLLLTYFIYDFILGILGISLTLFAAFEFKHTNIKNMGSGTLDDMATVTYDEMIEHSFYQIINLCQIIYLHAITFINFETGVERHSKIFYRSILCIMVTIPWLFRNKFPIHKFSTNYKYNDNQDNRLKSNQSELIQILYRLKKYQYIFYKHFILHGLNITMAVISTSNSVSVQSSFRLFWLLLNASYVLEFFLQTLVKKKYLKQSHMLILQQILMLASTLSAIDIIRNINVFISFLSCFLNFTNRGHEFFNVCIVIFVSLCFILIK